MGTIKKFLSWAAPGLGWLAYIISWSFIELNRFSSKSDVWSFGVLCWEVFTNGLLPYTDLKNAEVVAFLDTDQTLKCPHRCLNSVYAVS